MVGDMTAATAGGSSQPRVPTWTFGDRLRKIRRDVLALDQHELARELGITKAAYAAWESSRNEPRSILAVARQIELISGVPAAWILGVDQPTPVDPVGGPGAASRINRGCYGTPGLAAA